MRYFKSDWIPWIIGIGVSLFIIFAIMSYQADREKAGKELTTYEGRVTAIISGSDWTKVYLNGNNQAINIKASHLSLVVGAEYEIILDGNGKLINAIIKEQPSDD